MGGALFSSGPDALDTPRMPPAVYYAVRAHCQAQLRPLFAAVATPVDGPAKADYGDIDIMAAVAGPSDTDVPEAERTDADADPVDAKALYEPLLQAAAARLGAVRAEYQPRLGQVSVAIRWADAVAAAKGIDTADNDTADSASPRYIQVDLTLCPSLRRLRWGLFCHGHGDLRNILSVAALQPAGLTCDERALWLRVPEIEAHDRRRARVFLTDDPATVLAFLGLDAARERPAGPGTEPDVSHGLDLVWTTPFPSAAALFDFVARSRFYTPPVRLADDADAPPKARRRMRQRPLFRQWVEERGTDAAVDTDADANADAIRADGRAAAFAAFPPARDRYDAVRTAWVREQHAAAVRTAAKDAVPATLPAVYRGIVVKAVRQRLFGSSATADADADTAADADPYAPWTVDSVTAWVTAHWRELGAAAAPSLHAEYERAGES